MIADQPGSATVDEVLKLKEKFEKIKTETEEFIASAKHLSETGITEAKEIIELAKTNWQELLTSFGGPVISNIFKKAKRVMKKAKPKSKKKSAKKKAKKRR